VGWTAWGWTGGAVRAREAADKSRGMSGRVERCGKEDKTKSHTPPKIVWCPNSATFDTSAVSPRGPPQTAANFRYFDSRSRSQNPASKQWPLATDHGAIVQSI
jgi:hypothetical protein